MSIETPVRSDGYRHLFGEATPDDRYKGPPLEEERDPNLSMLRWLAERFERPYPWPGGVSENELIPAGYTYLAQFVIHDSVHTLHEEDGKAWPRNARPGRLLLDAIYGRGPAAGADALLYCTRTVERPYAGDGTRPAGAEASGFLRIGGQDGKARPIRDLPRTSCPFAGETARSDVLIADQRNDDNVIIAQLTVLFHLLHNIVYAELHEKNNERLSDRQIFARARKIVTRVYRKVVFEDLLKRLLHPRIYEIYKAAYDGRDVASIGGQPFFDADGKDDTRMPLEFSHAVARFGHFMVRDSYGINAELPGTDQSIKSILRNTSARRPSDMPLAPKWLADWATLFQKPNSPRPLMSRRLGPAIARTLVRNDHVSDRGRKQGEIGGLVYLDLLRGYEANLGSGQQVKNKLVELWPEIDKLSPSQEKIGEALEKFLKGAPQDAIEYAKQHTPLLLFILLEAAETGNDDETKGQCLGAVGSAIVAEFFFKEYLRGCPLIEADKDVREDALHVFKDGPGTSKDVPGTMPDLIGYLSSKMKWTYVKPKFW